MAEMTGPEALDRAMKRHAMNANRIEVVTAKEVSGTTIRGWVQGAVHPRANKLLAAARHLGDDGPGVLRAYGFEEAAKGLEEALASDTESASAPAVNLAEVLEGQAEVERRLRQVEDRLDRLEGAGT